MDLHHGLSYAPHSKLQQLAPKDSTGKGEEKTLAKQGKRTPEPIREFVIETYRGEPDLSDRELAERVEAKFGQTSKIDKSTVNRLISGAGLGGRRTKKKPRRALPDIPEEWPHGFTSWTNEILRGPAAMRWSTDRPQQAGDEFGLLLKEALSVVRIRFLQGPQHQWDHPKRWRMILSDGDLAIITEVEGEGFIDFRTEERLLVRDIGVIILEPRLPTDHPPATCWAVDNIRLE